MLLATYVLGHTHAYFGIQPKHQQDDADTDDDKHCFCEVSVVKIRPLPSNYV